jgi:hypothetical protein
VSEFEGHGLVRQRLRWRRRVEEVLYEAEDGERELHGANNLFHKVDTPTRIYDVGDNVWKPGVSVV